MNTTFSHLVNFSVQSLALNKDGNKLIAAGISDWELFTIEEDRFVSNFILNPRLVNHRIVDIGWSRLDQRLAASCGSNGIIQKLIVTPSELRLENTYKFHDLTVSKIHFHPSEQNLLISGGQDGNIKLIDFRVPLSNAEVLSTFKHYQEDKVTDLQFNPHLSNQFASGSELGFIYIWDRRNPSEPEKRYKLLRNISHLDWHPEETNWLAVSRVDRLISILDVSNERASVLNSLTNPESISNIKWRPSRRMQIGACMSGSNYHLRYLYVWDLTRPYVPYASFDSVINKANNFLWRSSDCIIASAKAELVNGAVQSTIYNAFMCETLKPADYVTLVSVEMDKNGSLAFANGIGNEKNNEAIEVDISTVLSYYPNSEKFQITRSELFFLDDPATRTDWFRHAAINYRFNGGSFEELCDHNAQVALDCKRVDDYKNWMILKTLYKESDKFDIKEENSSKSTSSLGNSKHLHSINKINSNDNNSTIQIPISQVTAIANATSSSNDSDVDSSSSGEIASGDSPIIESNGNPILVNLDPNINTNNLKLKEDADNLNNFHHTDSFFASTNNELDHHDIQENNNLLNNSYLTKFEDEDEYSMHTKDNGEFQNLGDLIGFLTKNEREADFADNDDQHLYTYPSNFKSQSDLTMSLVQSAKFLDNKDHKSNLNANNTSSDLEINKIADLNTQFQIHFDLENALKINFDERFCDLLFSYVNEKNDLVTAIYMYLIAIQHNKIDKEKIDSLYLDEWFIQYIDLLAKYELWNQRIEILKTNQTEFLRNQAQKAHSYTTMCASCKITIKPGTQICKDCKKNAFLCSYCHLPVKRLYAWCNACCHGGHLSHMMKWFEANRKCPTGCGCTCSPNYINMEQNTSN